MFFSIIVPTYNRALILLETLDSVISQTFNDFEIIIVDDGSTDNTADNIAELKSERISYFYKKNEERSVARNYGADRAKGEFLIFLDSDDKMTKNCLSSIYQFIREKNFVPEFIFSGYVILNTDNSPHYEYGLSGLFKPDKLFYGNYLGCSSIIIKKELFKKYYFNTDKNIILFEDWELWLRIINDKDLYCFPGMSIIMINHENRSVLNNSAAQINEKILHFKNHILKTSTAIQHSFAHRRVFLMGIYSYAALHTAMTKNNPGIAIKYLLLSFLNNPLIIFKRRFYGVIKNLI